MDQAAFASNVVRWLSLALAGCSPSTQNVGNVDTGDADTPCVAESLDPYVQDWTNASAPMPISCGHLTLDDPDEMWLQARECALTNAAQDMPFTLIHDAPSIDSNPRAAYAARTISDFEIVWFFSDTYDGFTLARYTCIDLAPMMDCEPQAGYLCIECVGQTEGEFICE